MEIQHLTFHFPKNNRLLFHDLSMNIQENTVNILLGMNGEGKTTLFDIISGLLDTNATFTHRIEPRNILYQIQGVPILNTITGKNLAELILCSSGQYSSRDLSPKLFEDELKHNEDSLEKIKRIWITQYGKMSPGERRWFTVLLYCLIQKSLYIFDEPTAGTDPFSKGQIVRAIDHLQEKDRTVLYATHQLDDLAYFQHYFVHILAGGKIVLSEDQNHWMEAARELNIPFPSNFSR
ncbi:ABC transporter ATP-binding protein [Sporolactobacillus vineae]|uniref:AAA family ATPase n=1 Tax=Sporolactobacillus vineae TaxID=444463 RepID=UPI0002896DA8|nr:ABC transporter ATP-binding protein [Sporolactobacillus vineae]